MGWASFTEITSKMLQALRDDAPLAAFCVHNFGSELTAKKVFTKRTEVSKTSLPIVMLTVPGKKSTREAGDLLNRDYILRLYCGFLCTDKEKGVDLVVDFEELIEQALLNSQVLKDEDVLIEPDNSANDEGVYHPVYFIAMQLNVLTEQEIV